jgi:hypothetical protein
MRTEPPDELGNPGEGFVGYLTQGALDATPLRDVVAEDQLAWSDDGQYLAYGIYDTSGDFYDETEVVDAESGSVVRVVEDVIAPFTDWLPCPGGTCQAWQRVYEPPRPGINVRGRARGDRVIVSGELFRVPMETSVAMTLQRRPRAGAAWRQVTTVEVAAVEGLFQRAFPRPRGVQCKARVVYADETYTVSDVASFRC